MGQAPAEHPIDDHAPDMEEEPEGRESRAEIGDVLELAPPLPHGDSEDQPGAGELPDSSLRTLPENEGDLVERTLLLSQGAGITGSAVAGRVIIDGATVEGSVFAMQEVNLKSGAVSGNLCGPRVTSGGTSGSIFGNTVELRDGATVRGHVYAASVRLGGRVLVDGFLFADGEISAPDGCELGGISCRKLTLGDKCRVGRADVTEDVIAGQGVEIDSLRCASLASGEGLRATRIHLSGEESFRLPSGSSVQQLHATGNIDLSPRSTVAAVKTRRMLEVEQGATVTRAACCEGNATIHTGARVFEITARGTVSLQPGAEVRHCHGAQGISGADDALPISETGAVLPSGQGVGAVCSEALPSNLYRAYLDGGASPLILDLGGEQ